MIAAAVRSGIGAGVAALLVSVPALVSAQSAPADNRTAAAIAAWMRLDAPTGVEELAHPALQRALGTGWTADRMGNLVKRVGRGSPRQVIACAMDVPSLTVSAITDDGYLRLHRAGTPSHPLWDQFHEAQQVRVLTSRGSVNGVVAIANGHFSRQHRGDTAVVDVDMLWVDVGASTRADVEARGITMLDPVVAERPAWTVGAYATGPAAGARAGCAAVATAGNAARADAPGERLFVLSTQRAFGWVGLAGLLARTGPVDGIALFDVGAAGRGGRNSTVMVPPARLGASGLRAIARVVRGDSVRLISPTVLHPGSLVESISAGEAEALLAAALRLAGGSGEATTGGFVAPALDTLRPRVPRTDGYEQIERTLASLVDLPGVPGHEWRVREAITAALPAWAKSRATTDTAGNLIVAIGPDRDTVAFIAHMDEVAFEVEGINANGTVRLGRRGGVIPSAWEGQPALLHFDRDAAGNALAPIRGLFVPRDSARVKSPRELVAWFGADSAGLAARGVRAGMGVTAFKRGARLAGTRFTARASDDRTGSTALLLALQRIDPAALQHKVLFVWSTREEGGLAGAGVFGAQHGRSLTRVYAVDTFVSSDTPLEQPMFAFAPLGKGAVLRVLDDGSIVPRAERDRIIAAARARNIPLQLGTTHGSTDGSAIAPFGVPNIGLSWPGRYSHTPAETLDLRDVDALIRLIAAVATLE
jgi:putative aminopeptidase FrvX